MRHLIPWAAALALPFGSSALPVDDFRMTVQDVFAITDRGGNRAVPS